MINLLGLMLLFFLVVAITMRCAVRCMLNAGVADDAPLPAAVVGDDVGLSRGGAVPQDGWTALMWAAERGHAEAVSVLVGAGAALDVRDKEVLVCRAGCIACHMGVLGGCGVAVGGAGVRGWYYVWSNYLLGADAVVFAVVADNLHCPLCCMPLLLVLPMMLLLLVMTWGCRVGVLRRRVLGRR